MTDVGVLMHLGETLDARRTADPSTSYVAGLFARGQDAILRKVVEEAAETLLASKQSDKLSLDREIADDE